MRLERALRRLDILARLGTISEFLANQHHLFSQRLSLSLQHHDLCSVVVESLSDGCFSSRHVAADLLRLGIEPVGLLGEFAPRLGEVLFKFSHAHRKACNLLDESRDDRSHDRSLDFQS